MNSLPEFFAIKHDEANPLWGKYLEWLNDKYNKKFNGWNSFYYYGYDGDAKCEKYQYFHKDTTVLTLEQWNEMITPKIIGYKLIKPEYEEAASLIGNLKNFPVFEEFMLPEHDIHRLDYIGVVTKLEKAGVLDLWFEPVYEKELKLPKIFDYDGVINGDYLEYGCAKFLISAIKQIIKEIDMFNKGVGTANDGNTSISHIVLSNNKQIPISKLLDINKIFNRK